MQKVFVIYFLYRIVEQDLACGTLQFFRSWLSGVYV